MSSKKLERLIYPTLSFNKTIKDGFFIFQAQLEKSLSILKTLLVLTYCINMDSGKTPAQLSCLLLLVVRAVTCDSPGCFEEGECTESLLLDQVDGVEDEQVCLDLCQENNDCEYFTYYADDGTCMILANCENFSTDTCSNCYSGGKNCEGKFSKKIEQSCFRPLCPL